MEARMVAIAVMMVEAPVVAGKTNAIKRKELRLI